MFLWHFKDLYLGDFANYHTNSNFTLSNNPIFFEEIVKKTDEITVCRRENYRLLDSNLNFTVHNFGNCGLMLNKVTPVSTYVTRFTVPKKNLDPEQQDIAERIQIKLLSLKRKGIKI